MDLAHVKDLKLSQDINTFSEDIRVSAQRHFQGKFIPGFLHNWIRRLFSSLVCQCPRNIQVISETTSGSQTKLIRQSLYVSEHGIGYLNLVFVANESQKRPIFRFLPLKRAEGIEIQG